MSELDNLLDHFKLRSEDGAGYYLLGASFGGMIASDFATTRPTGLRKLVLVSANASRQLSLQGQELRRRELPMNVQNVINKANETRNWETDEYRDAVVVFAKHCICRMDPLPPFIENHLRKTRANGVIQTISGPAITMIGEGSVRDWDVRPRLHRINVPTFITNGEWDTSHDIAVSPFFNLIPNAHWRTFGGASHMLILESPEIKNRFMEAVADFLK
ncbi:hypothetical protein ANO11243_091100 [Dothideomycetidae sp. 11243]|nr:hypothetical protein ANO11243_091100 [fungal sp. No.11243]